MSADAVSQFPFFVLDALTRFRHVENFHFALPMPTISISFP